MPTLFMDVNFWKVLAAAVAYMVIGGIWYSPFVFGKVWMREAKLTKDQLSGQSKALAGSFIAAIVMGYGLGWAIAATHSTTLYYGAWVGLLLGVTLIATTKVLDVLYAGKSWTLVAIDTSYLLVVSTVMGAILGGF